MRRASFLTMTVLVAACLLIGAAPPASAQTKRIYLAPDDHTDYMWTANEAESRGAFVRMLDHYLDLADATQNDPADFRAKWNVDGTLWLRSYEQTKSAADFSRLIGRVRDGAIGVPLNTLVPVHGASPLEAVLRDMYYAGRLERRFGLRFPVVVAMENATLPYGLGSVFAGAGAKYSWKGTCADPVQPCGSQVPDASNREADAYWWGGPDGSRLLVKWNSIGSSSLGNQGVGGYAEARFAGPTLDFVLNDPGFRQRWPYDVIGAFGQGWDDRETVIQLDDPVRSLPAIARARSTATERVIVSNEQDFFQDFERSYGAALPTQAVSFGNEWELGAASYAELSAVIKRSVEKLRTAEALATLVSLDNPAFLTPFTAQRNLAYNNIALWYDHNFAGGPGVSNADHIAWRQRLAAQVSGYIDDLERQARESLGRRIQPGGGSGQRFFAFNPLGWSRSDVADLDYRGALPARVIDGGTGLEVPSQLVDTPSGRRLRVLAQGVPAVGYRVYEVRAGAGQAFPGAATVVGGTMENALYRVTVNARGAITSLVAKQQGAREFAGPGGLNALGGGSGQIVASAAGAVSRTLRIEAGSPTRTTRVTLYRDLPRIDVANEIKENFGDFKIWGNDVALTAPDVHHEEVGAVIRARLAPDGQYSPRLNNSRYDWLTLNHFADIGDGDGAGLTLSNADALFMKLGNSTSGSLDTTTPALNVLAGGRDPSNGVDGQGGAGYLRQRFAYQPRARYDQATAMRVALEHQNPLATGAVAGTAASRYPATTYSLLGVDNANVLLWALKPAEEGIGQGVIARVWNQSGEPAAFNLRLNPPFHVAGARQTTHIETNLRILPVSGALTATLERQQIGTYRLTVGTVP